MFEMELPRNLLGVLIIEQALSTLVCVRFLLKNAPQSSFLVANSQNFTVLHAAASIKEHGRDDLAVDLILNQLLDFFDPDINQLNQVSLSGYTALHFAIFNANIGVVKNLLAKGADPNIHDRDGHSSYNMSKIVCEDFQKTSDAYVDLQSTRPRNDQLRLAKNRRERVFNLLGKHLEGTLDSKTE